ncbi:hypothetical protein ACKKLP_005230, partial [Escherichia coli]
MFTLTLPVTTALSLLAEKRLPPGQSHPLSLGSQKSRPHQSAFLCLSLTTFCCSCENALLNSALPSHYRRLFALIPLSLIPKFIYLS